MTAPVALERDLSFVFLPYVLSPPVSIPADDAPPSCRRDSIQSLCQGKRARSCLMWSGPNFSHVLSNNRVLGSSIHNSQDKRSVETVCPDHEALVSFSRRAFWMEGTPAIIVPVLNMSAPPEKSVAIPPASRSRTIPAAISQAWMLCSQ